ncbi:TetR/AcrR family transcriptional regulator [Leifsonia poae]|uniref:TetR/AcrR family transcriptional regulator n=1 Tax=Leifsonia poae TaxID=110933 RepID=UPI001CC0CA8A|nr:TetR family transcriptional regulator C-terminal domain-containing protein [Leifsonia poae]
MRTSESVEERRRHIGEAVWRVIRRDGINAVSTRTVAAEAGMVLGSLRHYFPRQADVVEFAMRLVIDRTTERVRRILHEAGADGPDPQLLLEQFLPLDDERREEMEVWLVFAGATLSDATLAPVKRDSDAALLLLIRQLVEAHSPAGTTATELDRAADRLRALIDGMAAHLVGPAPALDSVTARAILAAELDRIGEDPRRAHPQEIPGAAQALNGA